MIEGGFSLLVVMTLLWFFFQQLDEESILQGRLNMFRRKVFIGRQSRIKIIRIVGTGEVICFFIEQQFVQIIPGIVRLALVSDQQGRLFIRMSAS